MNIGYVLELILAVAAVALSRTRLRTQF